MSSHAFVLADQDRVEQLALVARSRGLLRGFELHIDAQGVVWARKRADGHCFAVSMLGPGWVFDPYACERRADDLARRQQAMDAADPEQQRRELERIVGDLHLGPIAERVFWMVYRSVLQVRLSVIRIPDGLLGRSVWGPDRSAWPQHWRRSLHDALQSLAWLHVAAGPEEGAPTLGQQSALLTHTADLRGSPRDACDNDCPARNGPAHSHFLANIGRGFLGILEQFAQDDASGIRTYEFKVRGRKGDGPTLREAGKSGKLVTVYLPAKLGDPTACAGLTTGQHRLLQAIVRETTRKTKGKRSDLSEAEVLTGNEIPGIRRRSAIRCDLLEPGAQRVGFNGNGKRKRLGYGLSTPGGWLAKAGHARTDTQGFLDDLKVLVDRLGLIPVGIHVPTDECFGLSRLRALAGAAGGRATLDETHLRIYAAADYVTRWNEHFGWDTVITEDQADHVNQTAVLVAAMDRKGISQRALATGVEADPSFVSKLLSGKKVWPDQLLSRAQEWVEQQEEPGDAQPGLEDAERASTPLPQPVPLMPRIAALERGEGAMLDVVLAYRRLGWAVIPQNPGAKQPCVKWKAFQERLPTEQELGAWFAQWPLAGLAVVLGPVSGLLVVDVDSADGHQALLERLGSEPRAPKALSGSRQPDRYHLFFRCPDLVTRAKATPWHQKLEFRAKGGIVVVPPSLHSSGYRYAWAEGQSPDDLPFPTLPEEIIAALRPSRPTPPVSQSAAGVSIEDASSSTREFLAGQYANGPNWNERLFRAACDLAARGMSRDQAEPLLLAGARPWDDSEAEAVRRSIASAFSEPRKPSRR